MRPAEVAARLAAIAAACVVDAMCVPGAAQAADGPANAVFKLMDENRDGRVSAAEYEAAAQKMFETMDVNRDGRITAAELQAAGAQAGTAPSADEPTARERIAAASRQAPRGSRNLWERPCGSL